MFTDVERLWGLGSLCIGTSEDTLSDTVVNDALWGRICELRWEDEVEGSEELVCDGCIDCSPC